MAGELEELCGNCSLSEGEKSGIKIAEGEIVEAREKGVRCLVGKLGSRKRINNEAFKQVLSRIWRPRKGIIFKEVQDNLWIFEFEEDGDKRRVFEGRPWSYDRQILVINELDCNLPPSQMQFSLSPIWVQVHDMPLICMTKGVGEKIGESLGILEDVDVAGDGAGWGRCLRIRVSIDVTKPLERGRALNLGGKTSWVNFKYEKLPLFCFSCGCIVHGNQGCPVPRQTRLSAMEDIKKWGVWPRAEDPRRRWNGGSNAPISGIEVTEDGRQDRATEGGGLPGAHSANHGTNHSGMQLPRAVGIEAVTYNTGSVTKAKYGEIFSPTGVLESGGNNHMQESSGQSIKVGNISNVTDGLQQEDILGHANGLSDGLVSQSNHVGKSPHVEKDREEAHLSCMTRPVSVTLGLLKLVDVNEGTVGGDGEVGGNIQYNKKEGGGINMRKWKKRARTESLSRVSSATGVVIGRKRATFNTALTMDGMGEGSTTRKKMKEMQGKSVNELAVAVEQPRQGK
jgi:hypothetical protein